MDRKDQSSVIVVECPVAVSYLTLTDPEDESLRFGWAGYSEHCRR